MLATVTMRTRTGRIWYTALHCTALPFSALQSPALHYTALHCPALPCTANNRTLSFLPEQIIGKLRRCRKISLQVGEVEDEDEEEVARAETKKRNYRLVLERAGRRRGSSDSVEGQVGSDCSDSRGSVVTVEEL